MTDRRATNSVVWLIVGLIIVALVMAVVMAIFYSDNDTGFGMMGGSGLGFGAGLMIIAVVILALIIVIALGGSENHTVVYGTQSNAQEILDQRYARGEISQEEYVRMKGEIARR